jgi:hypothetical protein
VFVTGGDGYVLVTPEGRVEPLDLETLGPSFGRPRIATDATTPNLAYVRALDGDRAQAVVRDLATGEETPVGTPFATQEHDGISWLSGDLLHYFRNGQGHVVNWRTGKPSRSAQRGWWQGSNVSIDYDQDGTWTLTTFDGDPLLTVASGRPSYGSLSPDGRFFAVSDDEQGTIVHELASGTSVELEGRGVANYGWSPDGHLIGRQSVANGEIEVCDPASGDCEVTGIVATGQLTLVAGTPGTAP